MAEDIEVKIPEDQPPVIIDDKPSKRDIITPEEGIEELRAALENEKKAREAAELQARQASSQAQNANREVTNNNLVMINQAISTVKNNQAVLKQHYAAELAKGNFEAVADINFKINEAISQLSQLETGKRQYEEEAKRPPAPVHSDPVEAFASQLTPKSAEWVRAHPEYVRDQNLNDQMIAAHNIAMRRGIQADTPAYFSAIERILDISSDERDEIQEDPMKDAAKVVQRRSSPASAPVSRTSTDSAGRQTAIRISKEMHEIARITGLTDEQYMKNRLNMIKEGKIK